MHQEKYEKQLITPLIALKKTFFSLMTYYSEKRKKAVQFQISFWKTDINRLAYKLPHFNFTAWIKKCAFLNWNSWTVTQLRSTIVRVRQFH